MVLECPKLVWIAVDPSARRAVAAICLQSVWSDAILSIKLRSFEVMQSAREFVILSGLVTLSEDLAMVGRCHGMENLIVAG